MSAMDQFLNECIDYKGVCQKLWMKRVDIHNGTRGPCSHDGTPLGEKSHRHRTHPPTQSTSTSTEHIHPHGANPPTQSTSTSMGENLWSAWCACAPVHHKAGCEHTHAHQNARLHTVSLSHTQTDTHTILNIITKERTCAH